MVIITVIIVANIYQALTLPRAFPSLPYLILSAVTPILQIRTEAQGSRSPAQVRSFAFRTQSAKVRFELKSAWLQRSKSYRQDRATSTSGWKSGPIPQSGAWNEPGLTCFMELLQAGCTQLPGAPQIAGPGKCGWPCRAWGTWGPHWCVNTLHVVAVAGLDQCGPVAVPQMSSHLCTDSFLPSFTKLQPSDLHVSTHRHSRLFPTSPTRESYVIYGVQCRTKVLNPLFKNQECQGSDSRACNHAWGPGRSPGGLPTAGLPQLISPPPSSSPLPPATLPSFHILGIPSSFPPQGFCKGCPHCGGPFSQTSLITGSYPSFRVPARKPPPQGGPPSPLPV